MKAVNPSIVLGIDETANRDAIDAAYRRLVTEMASRPARQRVERPTQGRASAATGDGGTGVRISKPTGLPRRGTRGVPS